MAHATDFFIAISIVIILIVIYTFLTMYIWNVLFVEKIPKAGFKKIDFVQSLALGVFLGLYTRGTVFAVSGK